MTTAIVYPSSNLSRVREKELWLRCVRCSTPVGVIYGDDERISVGELHCASCGARIHKVRGVWRTLSPRQREHFASFMGNYEEIRRLEGRGSVHPAFYLALPFADLTGHFSKQWKIRARSYRFLERRILPNILSHYGTGARVLDIGSGNGWLSYRLALHGLRPVAVDLCCSAWDGLEAAQQFSEVLEEFFPCVEASMDQLPFLGGQFDVAIFNASFHYSTEYARTLREVIRCLRPGGKIIILDSPTYRDVSSGEKMRAERSRQFEIRFGLRSDTLDTCDYLTPDILDELAGLGIRWTRHLAWYGLQWWLRPWLARLKGRRTPSQFYIYEGQAEAK